MDVEHGLPGDAAEESLNRLIEARAEGEEVNREAQAWAESARKFHLAASAARRRERYEFHMHMQRLHTQLSEEHREKALQLVDEGASS